MTLDYLRNAREQLWLRKQFAMILRNQQEEWAYGRAWVYGGVAGLTLFNADINIDGDVVSGRGE